jgi:uncharacterized protein
MDTVIITGGTGLVGSALTKLLTEKGYKVIILSRHLKESKDANISYATWNIAEQTIDTTAISKADYIIHLAGAGVADKRWTRARKKEIEESRTQSSGLLVKALRETPNNVKVVVSASAIGWYGDDTRLSGSTVGFTEDTPNDDGFLGNTCKLWEASIAPVEELGIRLVKLRLGIVLSKDGGALKEFIKPVKFGIATILGSGKQVISWIHIEDVCRMFLHAIKNDQLKGAYNAVAPSPVTNHDLIMKIAEKIKGKFFIPAPVPAFVLKTMLGEMSVEVLKSTKVNSDKIKRTGFAFLYPSLEAAIDNLV